MVAPYPSRQPTCTTLYEAQGGRVLRLCRTLLADPDEAADARQEVFVRVERACRGAPPTDWTAWITRVTVNVCWDRRRSGWWRWWRRRGAELDGNLVAGPTPSPEQDVARHEQRARIWSALRRLPHRQREVFVLRHVEGLATHEVADLLGIAAGSVKRHLFRAVRALRLALEERP
jgi:RNA polymerase sigma-70 factor, ECF subfamily